MLDTILEALADVAGAALPGRSRKLWILWLALLIGGLAVIFLALA